MMLSFRMPICNLHACSEDQVGNVKRSIVSGPTIFVPDTRQWLHTFKWHGSPSRDNSDAKGNKVGMEVLVGVLWRQHLQQKMSD
jgi:hypothetical protein